MSLPSDLSALVPIVEHAPDAVFLVDFDGSLAPIVDDPASARALPAARAALARLVPLVGRAAVVSGRPASFLREHVAIDALEYVGLYGLERMVAEQLQIAPGAERWVPAIAAAADEAERRLPGLLVERKGGLAVTIHWRTSPDDAAAAQAVATELSSRLGIEAPLRGRMAVELRPPLPVDKGTVVEELARGMRVAAFAGDDAGDLPAFETLTRLQSEGALVAGVRIGVRSPEAPPAILSADVVVDGPSGLAAALDALARAISARDR